MKRLQGPAGSFVLLEENRDLPLVRFSLTFRLGAGDDSSAGLSNFASELMARGAGGKSREEIDRAWDALGASFDISTDYDWVSFDFTVLQEKLESAAEMLATIVLRPDFANVEAQKLQRELLSQIDDLRDDDGVLCRRFFNRALFADHPYGRSTLGTRASIESLNVDRARAWHKERVVGAMALFGVSGAIDEARVASVLAKYFANITPGRAVEPVRPDPKMPSGAKLLLVDKPDRSQSQILMGQPTINWRHADYQPLTVGTTAFGGTFTARLMDEVRSKRGLSYGCGARIQHGRGKKALVVNVFPSLEQTIETLTLVLGMYADWVKNGLRPEEIDFAKNYLSRNFAFSIATADDRLDLQAALELFDIRRDYLETYVARTRAVTVEQVNGALASHLHPTALQICVVSTADALLPLLEKSGLFEKSAIEVVDFESY